jgi:hypothetical protein
MMLASSTIFSFRQFRSTETTGCGSQQTYSSRGMFRFDEVRETEEGKVFRILGSG